jgi:hypothetical protein
MYARPAKLKTARRSSDLYEMPNFRASPFGSVIGFWQPQP